MAALYSANNISPAPSYRHVALWFNSICSYCFVMSRDEEAKSRYVLSGEASSTQ